jgi:tetratricopeptide (TPR) repeat protein
VLGKTFTRAGLHALTGLDEAELELLLASLVRKEILTLQADPRSPERGQYAFLHALVQKVAYDTLSLKERKARHLAAAAYLETSWGPEEEEIVEVIASHYLEAYRAAPEADDAAEIKAKARDRLARAGERAASLVAHEEALRYFEQAADLSDEPLARAGLQERAAEMAASAGRPDEAVARFEDALALLEGEGRSHAAARVSARLGHLSWDRGLAGEAVERMERSFQVLAGDEPDEDLASLAAELARVLYFTGDYQGAAQRIDFALEIVESLQLPAMIADALITKAVIVQKRQEEAIALLRHALLLALESGSATAALRAYFNLAHMMIDRGRYEDAVALARDGLDLARRHGSRYWELRMLAQMLYPLSTLGSWDEALARAAEIPAGAHLQFGNLVLNAQLVAMTRIHIMRGELGAARTLVELGGGFEASDDLQERASIALPTAMLAGAEGRFGDALAAAEEVLRHRGAAGRAVADEGFVEALAASLALGELERADELLGEIDELPPAQRSRYLQAQRTRFVAALAGRRRKEASAERSLKKAAALFRELGMPFWTAVTELEHLEWLAAEGRLDEAEPLLAGARETFERLGATPWLERAVEVATRRPPEVVVEGA